MTHSNTAPNPTAPAVRQAEASDAADLAMLIDIAGEGIPRWLWSRSSGDGEDPLEIGAERARRTEGGFSFRNALVAVAKEKPIGMVLSYPITEAPDDDPDDLPAPIAPFVELEAQSVGTWYINALAVKAGQRGAGIGSTLLKAAETLAVEAGYTSLSVQVYEQNNQAVSLYKRLGFLEKARARVRDHPCQPYYDGDVLLLIKRL